MGQEGGGEKEGEMEGGEAGEAATEKYCTKKNKVK